MGEELLLTAEGAERMREELKHLKGVEREMIAQRLRAAVSMGDLSENADYHKAKEDQAFLEGRIQELEFLLKNAVIVNEKKDAYETVEVGARVTFQEEGEEPESFWIVGAKEADPGKGKISNESPIGRALYGGRIGDIVVAQTPGGEMRLKILKIE